MSQNHFHFLKEHKSLGGVERVKEMMKKQALGQYPQKPWEGCMDRKSKTFIIKDKFSLSHHLNNLDRYQKENVWIGKIQTVWPQSSIFLHFSPLLSHLLDYNPCLASAPYIQTVCDTAECQICIGCIGNTFICVYRIHDTEIVKLPYLPEYVSSKCSKEESKMCSFL